VSALAARLARRLREMGQDVPEGMVLRRTHAGHWQRSQGAWSWTLDAPDFSGLCYGSHYAASALVRCRHWTLDHHAEGRGGSMDEVTIDPCRECARTW
jgi:hypothetical protein